jgi:hypothetical protein
MPDSLKSDRPRSGRKVAYIRKALWGEADLSQGRSRVLGRGLAQDADFLEHLLDDEG